MKSKTNVLWSNCLVVKVRDSQSRGPVFKITGWLQGQLRVCLSLYDLKQQLLRRGL